ncbi:motile sperm domain-containing protein 2-like isoform X2 [Littorina saxatilis]|uniref:Motile sperm domain-containing protein 2 n=1 Tax=Littorina saxatilis TaxID=31220 RepID=A0AAN9B3J9_9CAEN
MGVSDAEIKYVRENFEKKYADKISSDTYDERDLRRLRTDNVYATTFIRGPDRLDEGVDLVHESLRFRKEYGVNDLTEDSFDQWVWDKRALFLHNRTNTGHKILYVRVKEHKKDASKILEVKKFFIFWLEMSFRADPLEKVVTFFDMSEAGLSNLDMEFIRFILTCFKLYYPTFLEKLLIYEMPWIFNAAWRVIKTWLSQEALARIKFATKSDIQSYIDKDQLFEHMGGTAKLDEVEYRPTGGGDSAMFSDTSDGRRVTFSDSSDVDGSAHTPTLATSPNANNNASHRVTSPKSSRRDRNASASESGHFTGRLLTISPADELTFVADESGKEPYDVITLTNTLMHPIAFKVKTTAPEKYRVRPSTGVVKPGEAFEVYVYLLPGYMNTVERDKFLVMAMEVTGDTYDVSLWKTAPKDSIMEHRMRCVASNNVDFNVNLAPEGGMSRTHASARGGYKGGGIGQQAAMAASQAKSFLMGKLDTQQLHHPFKRPMSPMEMLIESNNQLRRRMGYLIISHVVFFILTLLFFGAFFCLGEDLFSSYLYFPFGYCVSNSWSRRC